MKSIKLKKAGYWMSVITLGIVVGISLQFAAAWTEPTVAPPGGNLGSPLNTSVTAQGKAGGLNVGYLGSSGLIMGNSNAYFAGNVGIGTTTPNATKGATGYLTVKDIYVQNVGKWASELGGVTGEVSGGLYGTCTETSGGCGGGSYVSGVVAPAYSVRNYSCACPSGYVKVVTGSRTDQSCGCGEFCLSQETVYYSCKKI